MVIKWINEQCCAWLLCDIRWSCLLNVDQTSSTDSCWRPEKHAFKLHTTLNIQHHYQQHFNSSLLSSELWQATTCSKHHTRTVMDAGCECAPWVRSANPSDSWALVIIVNIDQTAEVARTDEISELEWQWRPPTQPDMIIIIIITYL